MSKDVIKAIKDRVSTRDYLPREISEDKIKSIIEAAHLAPSAGNLQPWEFYVVMDNEKIEQLSQATYDQAWIKSSPVVIVISSLAHLSGDKYGERGSNLYAIQDTAAAIENLLLASEAHDLGSCWVGAFEEEEVKKILDMKEKSWPAALVTIGYPTDQQKETRPQRSIDEVLTIVN
jgi:nitroreductase